MDFYFEKSRSSCCSAKNSCSEFTFKMLNHQSNMFVYVRVYLGEISKHLIKWFSCWFCFLYREQFIEKMQIYTDFLFSGDEDNKLWTSFIEQSDGSAYDDFDTSLYSPIFPTSTPPHHFPGTPNTTSLPLPSIVLDYNHVSTMASICILLAYGFCCHIIQFDMIHVCCSMLHFTK